MTLYKLIKEYGKNKGESSMWDSVSVISDYIEEHKEDDAEGYDSLVSSLYSTLVGCHYDERFGSECIKKMYYTGTDGQKHYAPYWTEQQMNEIYNQVRNIIPDCYTEWDFYVTLNMIKSDYCNLLKSWFPNATEDECNLKVAEMAVAYLNDEDSPHKNCKVWCYFNN